MSADLPNQHDLIILDGGTGNQLIRRGMPRDNNLWSLKALLENEYHALLRDVHASYIKAGCDVITTSNYAVIPLTLERIGRLKDMATLTELAAKIASEARANGSRPNVRIAGCLPPLNESYRYDLLYPAEESRQYYNIIIRALAPHVDFFLNETMSCTAEAAVVREALQDQGVTNYWVSYSVTDNGKIRSQETLEEALVDVLDNAVVKPKCFLVNCGSIEGATTAWESVPEKLKQRATSQGIRLGIYPNGFADDPPEDYSLESDQQDLPREDMSPSVYLRYAKQWISNGISVIGGCCAIGPDTMAYLSKSLKGQ